MLDLTKPVRMRSGISVEILSTHLMGSYPILGKYQREYGIWKRDGSRLPNGYSPEHDLENVSEEREVWLNVYDKTICNHLSREEADNDCSEARIARIKIILKDFEGRFDE